jgi:AbiV family abortive infection protein
MHGFWFALKASGELLLDALTLFDKNRYSTALGVCLLAREELGKSKILLDFWERAKKGESISDELVDTSIAAPASHADKQRRSLGGISFEAAHGSGLWQLIKSTQDPDREKAGEAWEQLQDVIARKAQHDPLRRVTLRERAFYVDLDDSATGWLTPWDIPAATVRKEIQDAANDYASVVNNHLLVRMRHDQPELVKDLDEWKEKPDLPQPQWPKL